jgi:hypothetical protein
MYVTNSKRPVRASFTRIKTAPCACELRPIVSPWKNGADM